MPNPPSETPRPPNMEACVARIRAKAKPIEESRDWHAMTHRLNPNKPMPCPRCPKVTS